MDRYDRRGVRAAALVCAEPYLSMASKNAPIIWSLVGIVLFSGVASAQSLADIARKEEERRKAIKAPGKLYTNDDLLKYPVSAPPAPDPAKADAATAAGDASKTGGTAATSAGPETPTVEKGEAYWRKLASDARDRVARSKTYLDILSERVRALNQTFYSSENAEERSTVWAQRGKLVDELERLKKDIADQEKDVLKVEDDAKKANVPAGWIR
jgi:hypothetical protein